MASRTDKLTVVAKLAERATSAVSQRGAPLTRRPLYLIWVHSTRLLHSRDVSLGLQTTMRLCCSSRLPTLVCSWCTVAASYTSLRYALAATRFLLGCLRWQASAA